MVADYGADASLRSEIDPLANAGEDAATGESGVSRRDQYTPLPILPVR